jgi:hypothetical protein
MIDIDFCSIYDILMNSRSPRRQPAASSELRDLRIAVLGGSTTDEAVNLLELLLLSSGFRPASRHSGIVTFTRTLSTIHRIL